MITNESLDELILRHLGNGRVEGGFVSLGIIGVNHSGFSGDSNSMRGLESWQDEAGIHRR